jgi:hypothetical protein
LIASVPELPSHIALKLYKDDANTFEPYPAISAKSVEKETGLKNLTLISDVDTNALFDTTNSISYDYIGLIPTENDKGDFLSDDRIQKKRFSDNNEKYDVFDLIRLLFDDISSEEAIDFYRKD